MKKILKKLLAPVGKIGMGKVRFQNFFVNLRAFSLRGMNIGTGADVSESGEENILDYIFAGQHDMRPVVLDVGANVGDYTRMLLSHPASKNLVIHSFEPAQRTFLKLQESLDSEKSVTLHNFGFSDAEKEVDLFSNKESSGLASVYNRKLDHFGIKMELSEKIKMETVDGFCVAHGIKNIHFLKIDVEGHELAVLAGAQKMLREGRIKFIQFEFGGCNIDSRTYFQDFYYLLTPHYTISRILKDGLLPLRRYRERDEIFVTTNFLAELAVN